MKRLYLSELNHDSPVMLLPGYFNHSQQKRKLTELPELWYCGEIRQAEREMRRKKAGHLGSEVTVLTLTSMTFCLVYFGTGD